MRVAQEPVTRALLEEVASMADAHSVAVEGRPARLAVDQYLALAEAGRFRAWIARDDAGRAVGYCGMLLVPSQHTGEATASQDAVYLEPPARRGLAGLELLRRVDRDLVDIGVVIVYRQAPTGRDIAPLLARLGYEPVEVVYARRL